MTEFVTTAMTLPTVVFTALLGVVFLYWLSVMAGVMDMDMLDSVDGLDGALDGADGAFDAVDALDGADGALDAVDALDGADGAFDAVDALDAADGAFDAVDALDAADGADAASRALDGIDGAFDGAFDAADAVDGADVDLDSADESALEALNYGRKRVPTTIKASSFILSAWVFSMLGMRYAGGLLGAALPGIVVSAIVGAGAMVLAAPTTSVVTRPFRGMLHSEGGMENRTLIGQSCMVRTSHVSETFGQGTWSQGGTSLILSIRCAEGNPLAKGDEALIVYYDRERDVYTVEPLASERSA